MSSNIFDAVREHNSQNPYTDIFPYAMKVDFPIVDYPKFTLSEKEFFLYAAPAGLYNAARKMTFADFKDGDLIITNQRIAFIFENDSFQCPIADIKACEIVNDEMIIIETKIKSYTFQINQELMPYVHIMVNMTKSWHDEGKDLFEYRLASVDLIRQRMNSDEYQSLSQKYEELTQKQ